MPACVWILIYNGSQLIKYYLRERFSYRGRSIRIQFALLQLLLKLHGTFYKIRQHFFLKSQIILLFRCYQYSQYKYKSFKKYFPTKSKSILLILLFHSQLITLIYRFSRNRMLPSHQKKKYDTLFIKFDSHALQIMESINQIGSDLQVKRELDEYYIEIDQVCKNIASYLREIRHIFITKFPKSMKAVESIVTTINRKTSRPIFTKIQSATKKAAILISLQLNLQNITQILQSAWLYQDDIAAFPNFDNPRYQQVYKRITVIEDQKPEQTEQQNILLAKLMTITNASVLTQLAQSNSVFGLITFGLSFPRFAVDYESAELRNNVFLRNPSINVLSYIWNLPEKGAIGKLKYIQFQWIKTNTLLYIPKNQTNTRNILQWNPGTIPVRLIYNDQITFWNEETSYNCCSGQKIEEISQIIIHFHGGGFVSLSSCTTQSYTRRWSKNLNIPVLSVDYSMPPDSRFPSAVEDALAIYRFTVNKLSSICNINPKRIILAGDSAGGNLVCSLMGLIIREKLPQPIGLFLAYPATSLRVCFSPSRLHAFFTPILHPSLLYLCLREYLGPQHYSIQNHPLASPLFLTKHFVGQKYGDYTFPSKWPKTIIMVGNQDPLFDDSLRLCQRMVEAGVDVNCRVYKNMSHAFLSLEKVVTRGEQTIVDSILLLKECLK